MIALGLGDEPMKMSRAISSVAPYIDAVYVTLTGPKDQMGPAEKELKAIEERYLKKVVISYERARWEVTKEQVAFLNEFFGYEPYSKVGEQIFLFDVARNYALSQVPKEYNWILWMDCDDVFRRGDKLKELLASAEKDSIEAIYLNYIYQADIEDNKVKHVIIEHLRERIVKNDGAFKWVAPIHETLIEQRPTKKRDYDDCDVLHLAEDSKRMDSLWRNVKALEYSIFKDSGKDPRPIYYLAKAYYDLHQPETDERAKKLIYIYLRGENRSGWPEERAQACEYLAEIYRRNGKTNEAVIEGLNALIESESPTAFLNIATTYMVKGEWERALYWAKIAASVDGKKTTLVVNPKDLQGKMLEVLYNCHLNLGHIDEAWAFAVKLVELYDKDENILKSLQFVQMLRQKRDITKYVTYLADFLKSTGEVSKIKPLLAAIPAMAFDANPYLDELQKQNNPPKYWGDKEITIFCGQGFTTWSPKSLTNPGTSFVGGSEEAVIINAKELVKLGWRVTVYNDCGSDEGIHDGVEYKAYYKFNIRDHFNILVIWRVPEFFDNPIIYKKGYLWAHDILNPLQFPKERLDKITKIIVQSPWHRANIPDVPDDKVLISSNGIV